MLKRQRQSSPLPHSSSSSIPLVSDGPDDIIERNTKRRRTLPPVLDGTVRGWNTNNNSNIHQHGGMHRNHEDEYISEEDDSEDDQESVAFDSQHHHYQQHQSEYKSANNLLRELHTLNQHRLLFSSSSPSSTAPSHVIHASSANATQHLQHPVTDLGETCMTHPLGLLRPLQNFSPVEKMTDKRELSAKEVGCVTERYEHTNKLLGSLFLSRRRKLDSPNDNDST